MRAEDAQLLGFAPMAGMCSQNAFTFNFLREPDGTDIGATVVHEVSDHLWLPYSWAYKFSKKFLASP